MILADQQVALEARCRTQARQLLNELPMYPADKRQEWVAKWLRDAYSDGRRSMRSEIADALGLQERDVDGVF